MDQNSGLPLPTGGEEKLVALIGPHAALVLIEAFGGTRIYVSSRDFHQSKISDLIGANACEKLAGKFGGLAFMVPRALSWRILIYRAKGLSVAEIARRAGTTERTVYRILGDFAAKRIRGKGIVGAPRT